ncbi:tRNA-dihydrouridine(20) synthase [NAD(P)+]-like protein [Clonorchis sinensis]|uniref:tRNA-dihydrouridine(20) synthase [NAD(P)+]-like protein n=1 Tax=Clonorchis sinensis TaxID=79923 RepID=A0A419PT79_CLOSI|nr:tRNA-dihydrouridine(20) synthase [NAD(P)+]-like protein [Clonorchis sinensis]
MCYACRNGVQQDEFRSLCLLQNDGNREGVKGITKSGCCGVVCLAGWGLFGSCAWLETLQEMVADRCQWHSCCQFLSATSLFDPVGKVILGPMVRISTHPMRLLALRYGADYVFTEEIIDQKLLRSVRVVNDELGTIDYVLPDGMITFRTSLAERNRVILQLGTPDAERALRAATMVQNDVLAIDINMGCPKDYSVKGGMGAALLTQPEKVKEILTRLTSALRIPVTCKIRILPQLEKTLTLVKLIESTGVAALTVHGRTPSERPQHRNHDEVIVAVASAVSIPVIANGGSWDTIRSHEDIQFFRQQTGAAGVMVCRAAMWNPAIFSSACPAPTLHDLIREYLALAVRYDHHIAGTKYCIQSMLHLEGDTPLFLATLAAKDLKDLCHTWSVPDIYTVEMQRRAGIRDSASAKRVSTETVNEFGDNAKRPRTDDDPEQGGQNGRVIRRNIPYERRYWPLHGTSPKQILYEYSNKTRIKAPEFHTTEDRESRLFFSTVLFDSKQFTNTSGCKSKKWSEQAAALVCLQFLGLSDGKCTETDVPP